jgi:hypothetical protein
MTAGSQFHSTNFVAGKFCGGILDAEAPEKIEMLLLTKDMDQCREGVAGTFPWLRFYSIIK